METSCHGARAQHHELDLAIITEPSENPMLTRVLIAAEPLCVAMQADHRASIKTAVMIEISPVSGGRFSPERRGCLSTIGYGILAFALPKALPKPCRRGFVVPKNE